MVTLREAMAWALIANVGGLLIGLMVGAEKVPPVPCAVVPASVETLWDPCGALRNIDLLDKSTDTVEEVRQVIKERCQ